MNELVTFEEILTGYDRPPGVHNCSTCGKFCLWNCLGGYFFCPVCKPDEPDR